MLIDDVKGALAALKTEMQEDRRIKSVLTSTWAILSIRTWTEAMVWYLTKVTMTD